MSNNLTVQAGKAYADASAQLRTIWPEIPARAITFAVVAVIGVFLVNTFLPAGTLAFRNLAEFFIAAGNWMMALFRAGLIAGCGFVAWVAIKAFARKAVWAWVKKAPIYHSEIYVEEIKGVVGQFQGVQGTFEGYLRELSNRRDRMVTERENIKRKVPALTTSLTTKSRDLEVAQASGSVESVANATIALDSAESAARTLSRDIDRLDARISVLTKRIEGHQGDRVQIRRAGNAALEQLKTLEGQLADLRDDLTQTNIQNRLTGLFGEVFLKTSPARERAEMAALTIAQGIAQASGNWQNVLRLAEPALALNDAETDDAFAKHFGDFRNALTSASTQTIQIRN